MSCDIEVAPQVIHDTNQYDEIDLCHIPEDFCFLFNGKWDIDADTTTERKNIETLIRCFISAFHSHDEPPALILKTHNKNYSRIDYTRTKHKVKSIINEVNEELNVPSIYIIHGELPPHQLNSLYRHDKIKCYVSCSHGEGFGRPVLEATIHGKPAIVSKWSGHLDILTDEKNFISGDLVATPNINNGVGDTAMWYKCSDTSIKNKLIDVVENYSGYKKLAKKTQRRNNKKFNSNALLNKYKQIFSSYIQSTNHS